MTDSNFAWFDWIAPLDPEPTRESWLLAGIDRLARSVFPAFKQPKWRVTCGWPKGTRGGKHAIGQCWDRTSSNDGTYEIFISPEVDNRVQLLETLAHEMIHAIVGTEVGHKNEFVSLCKAIGLQKPWTATTANDQLPSDTRGVRRAIGTVSARAFKRRAQAPNDAHAQSYLP